MSPLLSGHGRLVCFIDCGVFVVDPTKENNFGFSIIGRPRRLSAGAGKYRLSDNRPNDNKNRIYGVLSFGQPKANVRMSANPYKYRVSWHKVKSIVITIRFDFPAPKNNKRLVEKKTINEKAKRLFNILGFNHKQFSKVANIPYATVHEFFNSDKNVTLSNFQKILKPLGIDLVDVLEEKINEALGQAPKKSREHDDLVALIENLDKLKRRTLLETAINLNKFSRSQKINEIIERVEKRQLA